MVRLRARLLSLAALGAAMTLSACGFTPLYAEPGVVPALAAIDVSPPDSREGYILREALEDSFGRLPGTPAQYRLTYVVDTQRYGLGARSDDTATRYELAMIVSYTLTDIASGQVVASDVVRGVATYANASQAYAGVVAAQDGEARAAGQVAELIRADLARLFAERAVPPAPAR